MTFQKKPSYFFPAEWERHEATWLGWPHNRTDWPGKMSVIPWVYGEMAKKISERELVHILVQSPAHATRARTVLERAHVNIKNIRFHRFPTNRGWTRDFGPIFVKENNKRTVIADFKFTAWARYPGWQKDNAVAAHAGKKLGIPVVPVLYKGHRVVLEGGGIDVNGSGTLITTEECLLHPHVQVRNPGFTKTDYENVFHQYLGASHTIWLGNGIAGDDTHGHVDDLCRFVNKNTVVLVQEKNADDANYRALQENKERLQGACLENGSRLTVVPMPMPAPLWHAGRRLPASYANFYISNSAVIVPTFNDPNDRIALGILGELFHDRPVVGIHAVDLVWGLGTLHCLTQQQCA